MAGCGKGRGQLTATVPFGAESDARGLTPPPENVIGNMVWTGTTCPRAFFDSVGSRSFQVSPTLTRIGPAFICSVIEPLGCASTVVSVVRSATTSTA